jgi:DNA-binding response OmpR family regulator
LFPSPPPHIEQSGVPTVMIVEDEAIIAMSLEDIFEDEGYQVIGPFSSCAEAIASLSSKMPTLAILDAILRDGSCLELARELRARAVPFMIYSGQDEVEAKSPEFEGITWIEKPAPPDRVIRAAGALIGRPTDFQRFSPQS